MNPLLRRLKIIDIIGIFHQIAKLCVNGIRGAAFTIILGDERRSLKGCAVQTKDFISHFGGKIMTFQIG